MKIAQTEFKQRRDQLAQTMGPNSVAIIATSPVAMRNRDADYKYRADSSFYYLTGFAEPEAVAVIETGEDPSNYLYSLFCRERDPEMEIWNGYRAGIDGAIDDYDADEAYAIDLLDEEILSKITHSDNFYYRIGQNSQFEARITSWLGKLAQSRQFKVPMQIKSLDCIVDEMRLIKSATEIEMMQIAADISAKAHVRAMQCVHPGMMEYALEAEINYIFGQKGCVPAYGSIVGGGANGCILHYVENDQELKDGDLVLIDAGCEYQFYAGDISRTFPVNGRFSPQQKALYQVVLDAQLAAIEQIQVGVSYKQPHYAAVQVLVSGLVALGLLKGEVEELINTEAYHRFYMHGTGHWLGMDVHDVGEYQIDAAPRQFEAGMVITVEPGLYIAPDDMTVDEQWRGIGIRIEDDVLVTAQGPHVLTANVVKSIDDIEQLMAKAQA
ncbi:Xaa-Pro aminopeptidase [Acinetobacter rudis]|uniref:Xaa-Pro aminopeptidase n=1 Tax=Acinetobacter rudis TaxID=632955 RepID=UPI00280CAF8E|nr:Xaa-Pro aminopeptidase [Acinetobacter rudis]MDQ8951920.1 Xaa-Pro aminopeptidase [Acinetobacter rudis]